MLKIIGVVSVSAVLAESLCQCGHCLGKAHTGGHTGGPKSQALGCHPKFLKRARLYINK